MIHKRFEYNRHCCYIGILKKFQGLGFIISTDNMITSYDYWLIEFKFLWFKFWYSYRVS